MQASAIRQLAAAESARFVAAGFFERKVQIWDLDARSLVSEFDTVLDFGGHRLALSPCGGCCLAASWKKGLRGGVACYEAATGRKVWHRTDIRHTKRLRLSLDGERIFCGLDDAPLHELLLCTGETLKRHRGVRDAIDLPCCFDALPAGLGLRFREGVVGDGHLCAIDDAGQVRCLDAPSGSERWQYVSPAGSHVIDLCFHASECAFYAIELVFNVPAQPRLIRLDSDSGRCNLVLKLGPQAWEVVFCSGGQQLVDSAGRIVDLKTGNTIGELAFPQTEYPDHNSPAS